MSKNDERYLLQALEFEPVLRACLFVHANNNSEVDELLQEVYARLLTAGAGPDLHIRSVRAFALAIAQNVALERVRRRQALPIEMVAERESLQVPDEDTQAPDSINSRQELAAVVGAIQALPDRTREVFTLRKVYGYSQKEIAHRLNIPENTVEQHLTRAAHRCAEAMFETTPAARGARLSNTGRRRRSAHVAGR